MACHGDRKPGYDETGMPQENDIGLPIVDQNQIVVPQYDKPGRSASNVPCARRSGFDKSTNRWRGFIRIVDLDRRDPVFGKGSRAYVV